MYKLTTELLEHISERLQIKDKMPTGKVIIRRKAGKESFETFPFLLPNAAQITLDRRWNMAADEVSITIENRNGYYAPDYSIDKVFGHISQKDRKLSGYKDVMVPFNEMIIELGYGKETVRMFTGLIDKIKIDESPATLQIEGRNLIKKLFKAIDPIDSSKLTYENQEASLIIQDLCYRAGIPKAFFEVYEVEGKDFMINKIDFEIGIDYIDAINKILETMNHRLFCNRFGVIRLAPKLNYTQKDFPVLKLKDYVNLTQGSYAIDSSIVRNRIIVMGKEKYQAFEDPYLLKYCNDEKIAFGVEAPWADDEEKRWAVADSYFLDIRRKLRRMTVAIIGNPSLDVGDLVEVELLASQATSKYMVVAIQSSLSAAGYIDILDLEFVGKLEGHLCEPAEGNYSPPPGEDLSGEYNGKVVVSTKRDEIIQMAKKYIGVYYQWGGDYELNKNHYGFDCSHYTHAVYRKFGLMDGYKVADGQWRWAKPLTKDSVLPGDLVFWVRGSKAGHVGIYLGPDKCISALGSGPGITSIAKARAEGAKVKEHRISVVHGKVYYGRPPTLE